MFVKALCHFLCPIQRVWISRELIGQIMHTHVPVGFLLPKQDMSRSRLVRWESQLTIYILCTPLQNWLIDWFDRNRVPSRRWRWWLPSLEHSPNQRRKCSSSSVSSTLWNRFRWIWISNRYFAHVSKNVFTENRGYYWVMYDSFSLRFSSSSNSYSSRFRRWLSCVTACSSGPVCPMRTKPKCSCGPLIWLIVRYSRWCFPTNITLVYQ